MSGSKLGMIGYDEDSPFRKEEVTDLYICGIATDVCVGQCSGFE